MDEMSCKYLESAKSYYTMESRLIPLGTSIFDSKLTFVNFIS